MPSQYQLVLACPDHDPENKTVRLLEQTDTLDVIARVATKVIVGATNSTLNDSPEGMRYKKAFESHPGRTFKVVREPHSETEEPDVHIRRKSNYLHCLELALEESDHLGGTPIGLFLLDRLEIAAFRHGDELKEYLSRHLDNSHQYKQYKDGLIFAPIPRKFPSARELLNYMEHPWSSYGPGESDYPNIRQPDTIMESTYSHFQMAAEGILGDLYGLASVPFRRGFVDMGSGFWLISPKAARVILETTRDSQSMTFPEGEWGLAVIKAGGKILQLKESGKILRWEHDNLASLDEYLEALRGINKSSLSQQTRTVLELMEGGNNVGHLLAPILDSLDTLMYHRIHHVDREKDLNLGRIVPTVEWLDTLTRYLPHLENRQELTDRLEFITPRLKALEGFAREEWSRERYPNRSRFILTKLWVVAGEGTRALSSEDRFEIDRDLKITPTSGSPELET